MLTSHKGTLDLQVTHYEFGTTDNRGRATGAQIKTGVRIMVEQPEGITWGWRHAPGTYYIWEPHTTRDGRTYGPVQCDHYCKTLAERDAAISKYLKDAAKRASKLAAKVR